MHGTYSSAIVGAQSVSNRLSNNIPVDVMYNVISPFLDDKSRAHSRSVSRLWQLNIRKPAFTGEYGVFISLQDALTCCVREVRSDRGLLLFQSQHIPRELRVSASILWLTLNLYVLDSDISIQEFVICSMSLFPNAHFIFLNSDVGDKRLRDAKHAVLFTSRYILHGEYSAQISFKRNEELYPNGYIV